ncbi:MAG: hypothetical protein Q9174_003327 [Haloplaca sp. 1 TL-2023]
MDDETATLIATLYQEDLEELKTNAKAEGREDDSPSDIDLALRMQQDALDEAETSRKDRLMARSLGQTIRDDSASIQDLRDEDHVAGAHHIMASELNGNAQMRAPEHDNSAISDEDFARLRAYNEEREQNVSVTELMHELHLDNNREDDKDVTSVANSHLNQPESDIASVANSHLNQPESSTSAAIRGGRVDEIRRGPCASCEDFKEVVEVPCKHIYCRDCLRQLFTAATIDETLFPPRCCRQEIPLSLIADCLVPNLMRTFHEKAIEFTTVDRTYCHVPQCAAFIAPTQVEQGVGQCSKPGCGLTTCTKCKKKAHLGTCSAENEFEDTLQLGQEAGWQRCEKCRMMIELDMGCYHIT